MKKSLLLFIFCLVLAGCGSIDEEIFSKDNATDLVENVTKSDLPEEDRRLFQYAIDNTEDQTMLYNKKVAEIVLIGKEMEEKKQKELKRLQELAFEKEEKRKAASIPEGFCSYSWGSTKEQFPPLTFIMNPETSANSMYKVNNPLEINTTQLIAGLPVQEIYVFFTHKKLFLGRLIINRQDADQAQKILQENYGTPKKEQNKYFTSYQWQNDLAVIILRNTQESADIEIIEPVYYNSRP